MNRDYSDSQQVVGAQPDLNSKNNSASMTLTAVLPADLSVSAAASETIAMVGDKITVNANVSNSGPATATNVSLTDSFPDNLAISSLAVSQGACSTAPGSITCAIGTLTTGGNVTLSYVITAHQMAGVLANNLHVGSDAPEMLTTNNDVLVTVTVNPPPDFSLNPAVAILTMKRGGQVSDVLTFPAQGGFSGTIALTCTVSGPSPMPTCSISPNSATPAGSATLIVSATALSASRAAPWFEQGARLSAAWIPLGLLGCVLTGLDTKRRKYWAMCLLMMVATILPAACGGGSMTKGQPPQNYTVTVTATSGAIQHSTAISVTVQ